MRPSRQQIALCWTLHLTVALPSCAHSVHEVHVSDFIASHNTKEGQMIHAHNEQRVVLGFVNNINFIDRAVGDLVRKCPHGVISGITTEYMTSFGFPFWTNHIYLTGQCLESTWQRSQRLKT